jgi:alpha-L-fucosidase
MSNGTIEPKQVQVLNEVGDWLGKSDQSIYGTRGGPLMPGSWGASTIKDDVIYLHVLDWGAGDNLVLPAIARKIIAVKLPSGSSVKVEQSKENIIVQVAKENRQKPDTIVEIALEQQAKK